MTLLQGLVQTLLSFSLDSGTQRALQSQKPALADLRACFDHEAAKAAWDAGTSFLIYALYSMCVCLGHVWVFLTDILILLISCQAM